MSRLMPWLLGNAIGNGVDFYSPTDLQGNNQRIPCHLVSGKTGYKLEQQLIKALKYAEPWSVTHSPEHALCIEVLTYVLRNGTKLDSTFLYILEQKSLLHWLLQQTELTCSTPATRNEATRNIRRTQRQTVFDSWLGHPRISATVVICTGLCRWSAGFLGYLLVPPPMHSGGAPYSSLFALIGSQDLDVKSRPNFSTPVSYKCISGQGHIRAEVKTNGKRAFETTPNGIVPGFSQVGIAPDNAARRRVFMGISFPPPPAPAFRRCSILTSFRPRMGRHSASYLDLPLELNKARVCGFKNNYVLPGLKWRLDFDSFWAVIVGNEMRDVHTSEISRPLSVIGSIRCASKVKMRGSDTGDTNTHAQRLIAPTHKACSVSVLTLYCRNADCYQGEDVEEFEHQVSATAIACGVAKTLVAHLELESLGETKAHDQRNRLPNISRDTAVIMIYFKFGMMNFRHRDYLDDLDSPASEVSASQPRMFSGRSNLILIGPVKYRMYPHTDARPIAKGYLLACTWKVDIYPAHERATVSGWLLRATKISLLAGLPDGEYDYQTLIGKRRSDILVASDVMLLVFAAIGYGTAYPKINCDIFQLLPLRTMLTYRHEETASIYNKHTGIIGIINRISINGKNCNMFPALHRFPLEREHQCVKGNLLSRRDSGCVEPSRSDQRDYSSSNGPLSRQSRVYGLECQGCEYSELTSQRSVECRRQRLAGVKSTTASIGRVKGEIDRESNLDDLQARLYSLMQKYADISCTLVVCCRSGRRRLGQPSPGGVEHRVDQ
ncbi:hypothetical protein PR048_030810 [Dryococelus australis]|uniref:Uncharacterized protein n=1 Tax=Dryococelus australis TaxID=614101 RepID=A0ABQ9GAD8_9NEOP|nr:hypothetical protein PR048_030810 [Dryococelus australis]